MPAKKKLATVKELKELIPREVLALQIQWMYDARYKGRLDKEEPILIKTFLDHKLLRIEANHRAISGEPCLNGTTASVFFHYLRLAGCTLPRHIADEIRVTEAIHSGEGRSLTPATAACHVFSTIKTAVEKSDAGFFRHLTNWLDGKIPKPETSFEDFCNQVRRCVIGDKLLPDPVRNKDADGKYPRHYKQRLILAVIEALIDRKQKLPTKEEVKAAVGTLTGKRKGQGDKHFDVSFEEVVGDGALPKNAV